jgi:hypothetical protein
MILAMETLLAPVVVILVIILVVADKVTLLLLEEVVLVLLLVLDSLLWPWVKMLLSNKVPLTSPETVAMVLE